MPQVLLFDIDGTLIKPGDPIHQQALLDAVRTVYQVEASLEGIPLGGMLDSQIVRLTLEKYDVPASDIRSGLTETMSIMGKRYGELLDGGERRSWLLPGVVELLSRLNGERVLSVLTGNASGVARAKLSAAGIDHYFPHGAYGDSADHRYELVAVAIERVTHTTGETFQETDVVLIGDTPRDIEAARESGAKVLAVATGRYSVDDLAEHDPDIVFEDLSETERVLHELNAMADSPRGTR